MYFTVIAIYGQYTEYVGCFRDAAVRDLALSSTNLSSSNEVYLCIATCRSQGMKVACLILLYYVQYLFITKVNRLPAKGALKIS